MRSSVRHPTGYAEDLVGHDAELGPAGAIAGSSGHCVDRDIVVGSGVGGLYHVGLMGVNTQDHPQNSLYFRRGSPGYYNLGRRSVFPEEEVIRVSIHRTG